MRFVTRREAPTVTMNLGIHHPLVEFIYQEYFNNGVEIVWKPPPRRHSLNIFTYHIGMCGHNMIFVFYLPYGIYWDVPLYVCIFIFRL
ncbi:hypothetical protein Scep_007206 [Stephania cephalantha]|uniref:Uncharacterized protein n=1 Tax=Stephania cephalantha TaxID=152367 RepID=A0AAP0PN03_9MAGN